MPRNKQTRPLTVAEVASLFDKDPSTILRWTRAGRLTATKLPGQTGAYIYTRRDVIRAAKAAGIKVEIPTEKASA